MKVTVVHVKDTVEDILWTQVFSGMRKENSSKISFLEHETPKSKKKEKTKKQELVLKGWETSPNFHAVKAQSQPDVMILSTLVRLGWMLRRRRWKFQIGSWLIWLV